MTRADITNALDEEIQRLQQVKQLLMGTRGLTTTLDSFVNHNSSRPRRVMSAEGRRRIAEAQKRRWAKAKGL
jgi:hypothetical protein